MGGKVTPGHTYPLDPTFCSTWGVAQSAGQVGVGGGLAWCIPIVMLYKLGQSLSSRSVSLARPLEFGWNRVTASQSWLQPCWLSLQSPNSIPPAPPLHPAMLLTVQEGCLDPDGG